MTGVAKRGCSKLGGMQRGGKRRQIIMGTGVLTEP